MSRLDRNRLQWQYEQVPVVSALWLRCPFFAAKMLRRTAICCQVIDLGYDPVKASSSQEDTA